MKEFTTDSYSSYVYVSEYTDEDIPFSTEKISNSVNADYSAKDGRLVGIEILHPIPKNDDRFFKKDKKK